MRSINSIITRSMIKKALALALALMLCCPAALATTMDDSLTLGMISVKTTKLNPLIAQEREFQSLTALIYEGLYSLDDNYMPQKCLALNCDADSTGKVWTVELRDDIYFHDGTLCTAYDVVATINEILRLAEEGKGQYAQLKYLISSATANDAKSLIIKVSRPYYGIYYALTFPVLPQSQVQADNPVGTGPFKAEQFVPTNYLYLSANSDWWNGVPEVKNISVLFQATNRQLIEDYEFNRVDAAITRSSAAGQYRTGLTNLNISYRTRQLELLLMNEATASFPLDDERVRRAIRYAIDADAIANAIYAGTAERTDTPFPYGTWMYQDHDEAYEYNPEKAKALLAEAGWSDSDGDGMLDIIKDGEKKKLKLRLLTYEEPDNSVRVQAATMISDMLWAVGIKAGDKDRNVESVSYSTAKARLSARNFDLALVAFQMDTVPDPGFLLMSNNTGNFGGYKSSAMDGLFKQLRKTMDQPTYEGLLHQIQDQFAQDCPFVCLYYRCGALLTRKVFTSSRDIREPEILRGIESVGN